MTAAERGRNRGPRGDRGLDAIRTAAWLSASASGLAEASSSLPPLSGTMAGKAATRRRRDASASRPRRPRRNAGRRDGRARAAEPLQTSRSGVSSNGAAPEEEHFYDLVGEDDDWRSNPFAANSFGGRILDRLASGSFEQRDPDHVRENLPLTWLIASAYFRARVDGLENIPEVGPALLVGNHSGGNYIPDSFIFGMAFATYFGAERPFYALTHSAAMAFPVVGRLLRSFGSIPATRQNANEALQRGACVLVYPGGDVETYRPWSERNVVKFAGRMGFIRTALMNRVPLVPVVNIGSHETGIFLSDGQWLCRLLGLDRRFRIKATPIQFAPPWGLYATDFLPRILLPAKIEIEPLPPMEFERDGPEAAADDEYVRECYDQVLTAMQEKLDQMAARRRWPIIG